MLCPVVKSIMPHHGIMDQRMVWFGGKHLTGHLAPVLATWAGTPSTKPVCSKPCLTQPWTLPGMRHTAFLGHLCYFLTTLTVNNFFLLSNLNLFSFSLSPFPLVLVNSLSPMHIFCTYSLQYFVHIL